MVLAGAWDPLSLLLVCIREDLPLEGAYFEFVPPRVELLPLGRVIYVTWRCILWPLLDFGHPLVRFVLVFLHDHCFHLSINLRVIHTL